MSSVSTPSPLLIQSSDKTPEQVVENLKKIFQEKGILLFALVDHSGEAQKSGLTLPFEQLLIFGDPKTGTFLMQENPLIGLELPLKILIWSDTKGVTQIAYKDPLSLMNAYGIQKNSNILLKMKEALTHLVEKIK